MKLTRWTTLMVVILIALMTVTATACSSKAANQLPSITSLVAVPTSVAPGGSSVVTCVAADPDGDALSYTWTFTGGSMSGTGDTITWVASSAANTYTVKVSVSDGKGGVANSSVAIVVVPTPTPTPSPTPSDGSIDIKSGSIDGAKVIIDGVDTGSVTPYVATHVSAGNHTVKLEKLSYKWRIETVPVMGGETTYINWALTDTATQTLTLQPYGTAGKGTFVDERFSTSNFSTNPFLYTNGDLPGGIKRTYIQFDLSSIPSTAIILNANLGLYYADSWETAAGLVGVYQVVGNWNESAITWNNQPVANASPLTTVMVPAVATHDFVYWNIKVLAQGWVNGDITNQGVMLRDTDETSSEGWKFFSSSNLNPLYVDQSPKLIITYYDPTP